MKKISELVYEIKLGKVSKAQTEELKNQLRSGVIHVVYRIPEDDNLHITDIIGKVVMMSLLNNKSIVRVQFDKEIFGTISIEGEYEFKKSPKNGFVLTKKV